MPERIHIIGHKNSGKTTLVTELVQYLTESGYRVGTIKHTSHSHELDTPGKDSHRHRVAGAAVVGVLARQMSTVFWPASEADTKDDRYASMAGLFGDCDVLLVEGDSQTDAGKIEVWRASSDKEPLAKTDTTILALVTDDPASVPVPVRSRQDVASLAQWILSQNRP